MTLKDITNKGRNVPSTIVREPDEISEGEIISDDEQEEEPVNYSVAQRLLLVHKVLDMEVKTVEEEPTTIFGSKRRTPRLRLPASKGFREMFDKYKAEMLGSEGSKRAKNNPRLPLEVGKVPPRHKPSLKAYEIEGESWKRQASRYNTSLSSAFGFNTMPNATVPYERLTEWECSAREELAIANYNTWFLQAGQKCVRDLQEKFVRWKNNPNTVAPSKNDWESMWNELEDISEFIDAAGIGTKILAENTVSDIGSTVLTRRDIWLTPLLKQEKITKQDMWDLRNHDLNAPTLFDQTTLDRVQERSEKSRAEKLQRKLVYSCIDKSKQKENRGGFQRRPAENQGSFRGSSQNTSNTAGSANRGFRGNQRGRRFRGRGGIPRRPPPETTVEKSNN